MNRLALALACSVAAAMASAQTTAAAVPVTVEKSDFAPGPRYSAPKLSCPPESAANACHFTLGAGKDARGAAAWSVTLLIRYPHRWRFYTQARLIGGSVLPEADSRRSTLGCHGGTCEFIELVVFGVPASAVPTDGTPLRLQLVARQAPALEIQVPGDHISAIRDQL